MGSNWSLLRLDTMAEKLRDSTMKTRCVICDRQNFNKKGYCINREAPKTLSVEEYNFVVNLKPSIATKLNPKVGVKCLKSLRTNNSRLHAYVPPSTIRGSVKE
jgi:hypothetical protein